MMNLWMERKTEELTEQLVTRNQDLETMTKQVKKANTQAAQMTKDLRSAQKVVSGLEAELEAAHKNLKMFIPLKNIWKQKIQKSKD